jgi:hypothetical protein
MFKGVGITLVGVCVGLLLTGSGCGGDSRLSKTEYETAVLGIVRDLEPEASHLFFDIVANDYALKECATKTSRFHGVLKEIVDRVEAVRPPSEVADLQTRFIAAARISVDEVDQAAADVRRGRLSCGRPLNLRIYGLPSTDRAQAVLREYRERGYFPWAGGE